MFFNLSFSVASFGLKLSYHVLYTERPKADLVFQKWKENGEIKGHRQSDLANEASRATFTLLFEVISAPLSHASWNRWQPPKLKVCSMSEVESNQSASFKNFSRVQGFGTPSRFFFLCAKVSRAAYQVRTSPPDPSYQTTQRGMLRCGGKQQTVAHLCALQ